VPLLCQLQKANGVQTIVLLLTAIALHDAVPTQHACKQVAGHQQQVALQNAVLSSVAASTMVMLPFEELDEHAK
jgi:hypothetical protein